MSRLRNVLSIAAFLLAVAMHSFAGEPEPVSRIDLQPLGLKASNKDFYTDARVHWWRQYIVIDSIYVACGKCGPDSIYNETPGPRLVIDSTTRKQVPAHVVADAVFEPNPQDVWYPNKPAQDPGGEILSQWRGMTVVRDKDRKLWLKEPGHPNTLLFSRNGCEAAVFISPELILLIGGIDDHPDRSFTHFHQWVIDKTGALKYKLSEFFATPSDYFSLSREGGRFAVRGSVASKLDNVLGALALGTGPPPEDNVTRVRVFAAADGKKLFEYKWGRAKYERDSRRGIALSEDGALLALVKGTDLLIFRVPSRK